MGDVLDSGESEYTTFGTLKVAQRASLPDVLDVVVAGGGPGGTATAMRAVELGLSVQVIEVDELLREIRDFGPTKIVEPDYGPRADTNPFPPGGALVKALHFETMAAGRGGCDWLRSPALCRKQHQTGGDGSCLTRLHLHCVWQRR